jgi:hypothetical protein
MQPIISPRWTASTLRRDLSARAEVLARAHGYLHDLSTGSAPAVIFGCDDRGRHGNFHPASYTRICAEREWARRLAKVHTASRRSRARHDWRWMELDSCSSSDALLMSIFCHPAVFDGLRLSPSVAALLHVDPLARPQFGVCVGAPYRPRANSRAVADRTEIDLVLGNLFLEAKLTESDFQSARLNHVERYRDLEEVFDVGKLPRKIIAAQQLPPNVDPDDPTVHLIARPAKLRVAGYQLIRNVLAAYAAEASFCVLCDGRRHDLIEIWYWVLSAIHVSNFSWRLKLLTWQELAGSLPADLQEFLAIKYGIEPS